ncbi:Na(+)/H(+) antiporter subunit F [Clostridium homopropionicum DSM 5847]|uniref:Na(+)/H(+) antiporter subunit F n=1 Tax=Clostridium homopropionicum DSM 5847 TaxID=1121318 RepID=A0A0L6Z584_9CLOT|nr:monovalent cation/H+ antiporter complex subunit F [Clostridium homopropionicum]KOA18120.1 Na(+)/H(+) antiporter subunit F [Clostridium homopropionicum DSM 5847]SFG72486.1 multisubunit sodium/proton antiporter, MrpF subunit (TC 2.A.63.1) [Clostridium homopropionicum]
MIKILVFVTLILCITIFLCIFRAVKGPTAGDRLIAINVVGTKTIILILVVSFILHETYFIDVALVYALISFIASIVIAQYIKKWGEKKT